MQKRHERVPMDKKNEGFKSLFFKNNSRELESESLVFYSYYV